MAVIQISEGWRISGDAHQWAVERYRGVRRRKGGDGHEDVWEFVTSHQSLSAAARSLAERRLRTADVDGVAAVMAEWEDITAEIDAAFAAWRAAA